MTIFVESRASEITLPHATRVEHLEEWTGGDMLLSRLSMPCATQTLLRKHIEEGALIVQVKIGEDLAASVGDRLNESIARMRECTRRVAQHWLLYLGTLGCDGDGLALINGHLTHTKMEFKTVDGAIVGWIARGGVFYSLSRVGLLEQWVWDMERRLENYSQQQYKMVFGVPQFPDDLPSVHDDPLQIPIAVKDARRALIGFKGLGPELVNRVWEYCGDFKSAMMFLTDETNAGRIEGIGLKTIQSIRKQCGLGSDDGPLMWDTNYEGTGLEHNIELLQGKKRSA